MKRALVLLAWVLGANAFAGTVNVTVTDKDGKPVQDAVVVLMPSTSGAPRSPLMPVAATVGQEKMQFVPAVTLVPVGAKLTFANNDAWDHHVRGSAAGAMQFDASSKGYFEVFLDGKPAGKPAKTADVVVDKAGAILLGCHIHASMRGHVYVSDSPWALKTGPDGVAAFQDVPDGAARMRVWHADQLIDLPSQALAVGAVPANAAVQLQVVPRRRRI